ncbi:MAG: hypothetical protein O3A10_08125 [Chloroflexi bacterium]|nr:hypothetical protein [Chloroflexota bacterium]MDA1146442.1 hypothetical protein [Chloroflexota bacterium]
MALQPRPPRVIRLVLGSAGLVAVLAVAAVVAALVRTGDVQPELVTTSEPTLVFAEFGPSADEIFVAPASDPTARTRIQSVPHASGWGLNPAPEMVAGKTAYTVLPPNAAPERTSAAELWLLDVNTASASRLARDADLLAAPVLRQDGDVLVYRRTEEDGAQSLVRVDLTTRARRVLHREAQSFGLFPVGFDQSGAVLFTRLSAAGTDLVRVSEGSAATVVLHASDEIARDWSMSPAGDAVAFVAPLLQAERIVHQAQVLTLGGRSGNSQALVTSVVGEQYSPTWRSDGALAIGREATADGAAPLVIGAAVSTTLAADPAGFDVPLGWSAAGDYLAVRHFSGFNSQQPGVETLVLIGLDASRAEIATETELIFLGWTGA